MIVGPDTWRKTLLPLNSTLQQAIKNLDETGLQIVLVASGEGVLLGTITDGDIRRGLLRGLGLQSPIDDVLHKNAFVVPPGMDTREVSKLMRANHLLQVPVVDENRRVVGLHVWAEIENQLVRPTTMVIMVGGRGTRLLPYTEDRPKPMLPVAGKPMLEHIIERARGEGFVNFVLAVNYLAGVIESYCGDGSRWGVDISYVRETQPLGTAGALCLLDPRPGEPLIVTNGDVLADIRYAEFLEFHRRNQAAATMAVRPHEWQHPFGVVETDGIEIVGIQEKPISRTHINAGIYALNPASLDMLIANEPCDMPTLFERLKRAGLRSVVYPIHEPWRDVGQIRDLEQANTDLAQNTNR